MGVLIHARCFSLQPITMIPALQCADHAEAIDLTREKIESAECLSACAE